MSTRPTTREGRMFRSKKFKDGFAAIVDADTWDKGLPKIYLDEKGDIIAHHKNGKKIILKKAAYISAEMVENKFVKEFKKEFGRKPKHPEMQAFRAGRVSAFSEIVEKREQSK